MISCPVVVVTHLFFFNDTATTEIYTLSLHDALPISLSAGNAPPANVLKVLFRPLFKTVVPGASATRPRKLRSDSGRDRKSTRLNSSHSQISYAVFCLKKKISLHVYERLTRGQQLYLQ